MPRREHWSTWYPGTESDWKQLPIEERDRHSFAATGCAVAYPTWSHPVDCVHGTCQVLRKEIHPMVLVNSRLRYEGQSGWLRWASRERKALIYRTVRKECRRTQVYDAWQCWSLIVYGGILD